MKVYLDGKFVQQKDAYVSVFDHGFLYGDGVFEGIRSYSKLVFKLKEHVDRLYESAKAIRLKVPITKKQMEKAIVDTLKINKLADAYIRVIITRGEGDLGLDPQKCKGSSRIVIITDKITLYPKQLYNKGMEIITVSTIRNHPKALDPRIKSMNYLNNILAKIEATDAGYLEAIMLDHQGYVAECTGDNIFIVKNGLMSTPHRGILKGITRDTVLKLAKRSKIKTKEGLLSQNEVYEAQECFLTGTAAEIIPVVKVDGRMIGDGKPGKVTKKMMEMFKTITKEDGVKY
jgi:branched-chain amino acid aminotransferase